MHDVFLICPVRNASEEQRNTLNEYINNLETLGWNVYYPARDTNQDDPIGDRICSDNRAAIEQSKEVHVFFDSNSQGSLFDLGMAFALKKPIKLVNSMSVMPTPKKSFANFLLQIDINKK